MTNGLVTVVVVNWNSGNLLAECLKGLSAQSYQPAHVLVVDNGSTDGSAECARDMAGVTVRLAGGNLGFARANNEAFQECQTEFVALLNPDAIPDRHWLEGLVSAARLHADMAAFGSRQMMYGVPDTLDGIGDVYHFSGLIWREGHRRICLENDTVAGAIFSPCAGAALYRRAALLDVGGFDEDYFCYVEDVDLGFRLRLAGYQSMYVPDSVVYHVGSASTGGQHSDFAVYHGHRNLVWAFIKNMPGGLFWAFLPVHILLNVVTVIHFSMRGQGKVVLRAKRDAILGVPHAWRKRREIQAVRRASVLNIWRALDKRVIPLRRTRGGALRNLLGPT